MPAEKLLVPLFLAAALPALGDSAKIPAPDNSAVNKRDQVSATLTPIDQAKGSKHDVELTRRIRQLVVKEEGLSHDARNAKIITLHGVATLRGPVGSVAEKDKLGALAASVVGKNSVTNQLEVKETQ